MLWWTIQTLIGAAALCAIAWCACKIFRLGPVARHALWVIVLLKLMMPPVVEWPWSVANPFEEPRQTKVEAPVARVDTPVKIVSPRFDDAVIVRIEPAKPLPHTNIKPPAIQPAQPPTGIEPVSAPVAAKPLITLALCLKIAGWTWLSGSILFTLVQFVRILQMLVRIRGGSAPSDKLIKKIAELSERLGVRPVRIVVVPGIGSPMIWSLWRPVLLWPVEFPADMNVVSVRGLLLHELAHVKRKDHWVGWLELVAGCVWWWNPLFWYVRHRLREDAELACDAWVVQSLPGGRRAYANGLLAVCEYIQGMWMGERESSKRGVSMAAVGVATGGRRFLERRLVMVMREKTNLRLGVVGLVAVLMLGLMAAPAWPLEPPEGAADARPAAQGEAKIQDADKQKTAYEKALIERMIERRRGEAAGDDVQRLHNYRRIVRGGLAAPANPLPPDAQKVMDAYQQERAEAQRKFEAEMTQKRDAVIAQLTTMQQQLTKDGKTAEALAISQQINALRGGAVGGMAFDAGGGAIIVGGEVGGVQILGGGRPPRPGWEPIGALRHAGLDLSQFRGQANKVLTVEITAQMGGTVWGTGIYTDDSSPATAAIHAGILRPGQKGMVKITILPGQAAYQGSTANGVTTSDYGVWHGSYRIERAADAAAGGGDAVANGTPQKPLATPKSMGLYAEFIGQSFVFEVTGSKDGDVWGSNVYTEDSPLAVAAVHAGAVKDGEKGIVNVTIMPVQETYEGSTANGVTSKAYGKVGQMSFRIDLPDPENTPAAIRQRALARATFRDLLALAGNVGADGSFEMEVVGTLEGAVWGDGVYTDDSTVGAAAVHAGIIPEGACAKVKLTVLPGLQSYEGANRNGVTSARYGQWTRSFKIEKAPETKPAAAQ